MKRWAATATAVLAVVVLASCNDDGPQANQRSPGQAPEQSADVACPPIEGYDFPVADHGSAAISAPIIEIDAGDSYFTPTCALEVTAGRVTLRVTNIGKMLHNVSFTDQGIDVDVQPGETIEVDIEVPDNGTPRVDFCKYHRTAGMVGALLASS